MALNIAVPLSGVGDLSPISPIRMDCWENIKMLVSPIGSESSGVSSLDSEEAKQQLKPTPSRNPDAIKQDPRIYYNGRNILDLYTNLETNSTAWKFQYSHLPERNNISMFWANRSLYNRLGPNGLTPVYTINKCECCDFQYTSDCPNSYLSKTSLNLSSTTTSPMTFSTAFNKKQEYQTTKVTTVSKLLTTNATTVFNEKSFIDYKNNSEQLCSQNHVNKLKINDVFLKKPNILTNNNSNYNSINKINNLFDTTKAASDTSQITSPLVAANSTPSNTPPLNMVMSYNNTIQQCNESMENINITSSPPQNFYNSSLLLANATNSSHVYHVNNSNNVLLNQTSGCNKSQITSSNNLYSLFNSSKTNNSAIYAFNANGNSNGNTYINSFNSVSNSSSNNINANPFSVNSQHYGRMYKYF